MTNTIPALDETTTQRLRKIDEQIADLYREIRQHAPTLTVAQLAAAIEEDEDAVFRCTFEIETEAENSMAIVSYASFLEHEHYRLFSYDDQGEEVVLGDYHGDTIVYRTA